MWHIKSLVWECVSVCSLLGLVLIEQSEAAGQKDLRRCSFTHLGVKESVTTGAAQSRKGRAGRGESHCPPWSSLPPLPPLESTGPSSKGPAYFDFLSPAETLLPQQNQLQKTTDATRSSSCTQTDLGIFSRILLRPAANISSAALIGKMPEICLSRTFFF